MRGLQWWNSSSAPLGNPDGMVWTDVRTLRRMRAVRRVKLVVAVMLATAVGTVLALAFADVHSGQPAAALHLRG